MNRSEITLDLHGKVAIVTGAAQGIGRAIAILFASQGARVVVADILEDKSRAVIELIEQAGGTALALTTDVSKPEQIRQIVDATVAQWGRIDIVVNNAYWSAHGTVVDLDENAWDRSMDIMVKAIYLFGKYTFPLMIEQGGGYMVNIASVHGAAAHPRYAVYAAAKAGVLNLTRQMAIDFGPHNIRINAICPGWVITEHVEVPAAVRERAALIYPLGRTGVPEDIAKAALFLVSDLASFVQGHALYVDGGLTVQLQDAAAQASL
jgi:NAD(P)-dependent dehydrogenase (short-subunit alcohol dehydrogenase family)